MFLKLTSILLEYNQQKTIQNLGEKLLQANKKELKPLSSPIEILTKLELMDPSSNNQYTVWIVRQYIANQFRLEDANRIYETLATFSKLKNKLPIEQRDVGKFTFHALEDLVDSLNNVKLGDTSVEGLNYEHIGEMDVLYNGPYGKLIIPKTEEASCELGRGTKWCTAADENNMFHEYSNYGPLYVWIDKSGKKYQFHFETNGHYQDEENINDGVVMMDARDQPILYKQIKNPILDNIFAQISKKILNTKNPYIMCSYAEKILDRRWPEAEPYIMTNIDLIYTYAKNIIKGRWPEAESYILTHGHVDSRVVWEYAKDVIKGRWPGAEPHIKDDPWWAYFYAKNIIKGRWPEAEPYIMKQPGSAVEYAKDVIKGRWLDAEPHIMKEPGSAVEYAKNIIKGRWPEAEPYIMKDPWGAVEYKNNVIEGG